MTFHHCFLFSKPGGPADIRSCIKFCDDLMAPYGSTRLPYLMHYRIFPDDDQAGNGPIDERKFRYHLTTGNDIPQDSRCWLNVEPANKSHEPWEVLEEFPWARPQQEGIDFFHHILDVAQTERPDVKFAFFGRFPNAGYQWILNEDLQQAREELMVACGPLVRRLGFLLPYFYDHKVWPDGINSPGHRERWVRTTLDEASRFYPDVPIIGMPWCEYHDLFKLRPDPDTPEAQYARRLSGWAWWRVNQTIFDYTDTVLWYGGDTGTPWDETAEWWEVSKKLLEPATAEGG